MFHNAVLRKVGDVTFLVELISRIKPCCPNINHVFTVGDGKSLSQNDESLPNSTHISRKTVLPNPGCTLVRTHPSLLAKWKPAVSFRVAAIGVLRSRLAYLSGTNHSEVALCSQAPRRFRLSIEAGRGRNTGYPVPPAQIPAGATNALGSSLEHERQSGNTDGDVTIEFLERNER
jgi:hypothetical protein